MGQMLTRVAFVLIACTGWAGAQSDRPGAIDWRVGAQIEPPRRVDQVLQTRSLGNDPQLLSGPLAIEADRVKAIAIELAVDAGHFAQLFWPDWSEQRSIRFPIIADGRPHRYLLPVAEHGLWRGRIEQLRFDPTDAPMTSIRIHAVQLLHEPVESAVRVGGDYPQRIFAAAGASGPLQLTAVTTGTLDPRRIEPTIEAIGPVRIVGQADGARRWLYEGPGQARLTSDGLTIELLPIEPRDLSSATGADDAAVTIADFASATPTSQWTAPKPDRRLILHHGRAYLSFAVDGSWEMALGRPVQQLKAVVFEGYARGRVDLVLQCNRPGLNQRFTLACTVDKQPGAWRIDLPVDHRGPAVVCSMHVAGHGELMLRRIGLIGRLERSVELATASLTALEQGNSGNWIVQRGQPIQLSLIPPAEDQHPWLTLTQRFVAGPAPKRSIDLSDPTDLTIEQPGVYRLSGRLNEGGNQFDADLYVITPPQPWPLDPRADRPKLIHGAERQSCPH
jgi:hypothetical protein